MKNKKILVGILSASGIAMMLPAITSCSCKGNVNNPEVSTETPKKREVGAKATRTYFYITQGNINNPDETKVKLVNLKVNGAEASPVSGLIKSSADSAGNILVVFNMSLAQKQYNANTITFDLKLTNKKANTEYIVKDFEITLSDTASSVDYNLDEAKGINIVSFPDSVGEDVDLIVKFTLKSHYEWIDDKWDVLVDGQTIKQKIIDAETLLEKQLILIQEDGQECFIKVPQTLIPSNSKVDVVLKCTGKKYNVNYINTDRHVQTFTGSAQAKHGTLYEGTFTLDNYYDIDKSKFSIVSGTTPLEEGENKDYTLVNNVLKIKGSSIVGDVTINVECKLHEFNVDVSGTTGGLTFTAPAQKPTHGNPYKITYSLTNGKKLNTSSVKCVVNGGKQLTIGSGLTLITTKTEQSIEITTPNDITGDLTFTGKGDDIGVTTSVTGVKNITGTPVYMGETVFTFTMEEHYVLKADDFTNKNIVIKNGTTEIAPSNLTINEGESTVKIAAGIVTNDITISGVVKHYTASVTEKAGQTGIFTFISKPTVAAAGSDYAVTYTMPTGYLTPTATVKVNGTTLTPTTDYTITATGITIPAAKVTGYIEITDLTALKELKWDKNFEKTVAIGTTSTYAYSATATAGGTPTVSIKGTAPSGISLNSDKHLVVGASVAAGTTVTLQATLEGAQTIEGTVTVTTAQKEIVLSASTHHLDNKDTDGLQITAKVDDQDITSSPQTTWSVSAGTSIEMDTFAPGLAKVTKSGETDGGSATIKCEYRVSASETISQTWEVEVASWRAIVVENAGGSQYKVYKKSDAIINDTLIIPSKCYSPSGTSTTSSSISLIESWSFATTTQYAPTIVIIPDTITQIQMYAFPKAFTSGTGAATITEIKINATSKLESIGNGAFYQQTNLTGNLTIPATVKEIGGGAFEECKLTNIYFNYKNGWKTVQGQEPVNVDDPTKNASQLQTSASTWCNDGIYRD